MSLKVHSREAREHFVASNPELTPEQAKAAYYDWKRAGGAQEYRQALTYRRAGYTARQQPEGVITTERKGGAAEYDASLSTSDRSAGSSISNSNWGRPENPPDVEIKTIPLNEMRTGGEWSKLLFGRSNIIKQANPEDMKMLGEKLTLNQWLQVGSRAKLHNREPIWKVIPDANRTGGGVNQDGELSLWRVVSDTSSKAKPKAKSAPKAKAKASSRRSSSVSSSVSRTGGASRSRSRSVSFSKSRTVSVEGSVTAPRSGGKTKSKKSKSRSRSRSKSKKSKRSKSKKSKKSKGSKRKRGGSVESSLSSRTGGAVTTRGKKKALVARLKKGKTKAARLRSKAIRRFLAHYKKRGVVLAFTRALLENKRYRRRYEKILYRLKHRGGGSADESIDASVTKRKGGVRIGRRNRAIRRFLRHYNRRGLRLVWSPRLLANPRYRRRFRRIVYRYGGSAEASLSRSAGLGAGIPRKSRKKSKKGKKKGGAAASVEASLNSTVNLRRTAGVAKGKKAETGKKPATRSGGKKGKSARTK